MTGNPPGTGDPITRQASPRHHDHAVADGFTRLNHAPLRAAEAVLLTCCGSRRWARRMALHRPYPDLATLLAAADEAAYDLSQADLDEALTAESPLPPRGDLVAQTALVAAHAEYERRFGHVFVICLDAARPAEHVNHVLEGIRARLYNDRDEERAVTAEQLRALARGRLTALARQAAEQPGG